MRIKLSRLLLGAALWLSSPAVFAQEVDAATRGAARTLGYDGVKAYEAGDYAVASEKLEKAYRVLKVPSLGLWSARALARLGKLVEATERYTEVQQLKAAGGDETVQRQAQLDAEAELIALAPRVPSLIVELEGADAAETRVTIDGVALASELIGERRPTNPGHHVIVGVRGSDEARAEVELAEGERKPVRLVFAASEEKQSMPAPGPDSSDGDTGSTNTRRLLGWISIAAGGAGLAAGATFGALAMSKRSELEDSGHCRGGQCLEVASDDVHALRTRRTVSIIGFVAGSALAATGAVLVLTAPNHTERAPSTALRIGPTGVTLTRMF